ncbi:MAG: glutathione S-transferase [Rhodobacterales bacterium]|nr:glutathione S-transferase [Rhodobacterales bacterium]NCT11464.1 glutathione S-transferase [Rhodobacterales bacterium]
MKLLMAPASPFVRKVRVVLRETGQLGAVTEVAVSTTPVASDPAVVAANPTGKIPALLRDDGPALFDSRVITRFLDARAGARLYPEARIWEVLTLEALADAMMDAAVVMVYEARYHTPEGLSADWIAGQWDKVARSVAVIEDRWMAHLAGPLHIGQIGVACALGYLDFRHPDRDWRAQAPELAVWFAAFSERPSMVETRPGL